jgi:hypothetical protein
MGVFMPLDIADRITKFIAGKLEFPVVTKEEAMAAFYLFGKDYGVKASEVEQAEDMARKTVEQVAKDVRLYKSMPKKMDPSFTRENYTKRSLQIAVDSGGNQEEMLRRVARDPAILSDCFAQHVAYHQQDCFFELFQPLEQGQFPRTLQQRLEGRMLLLAFNVKDRQSLPFKNSLDPFFEWMTRQKSG